MRMPGLGPLVPPSGGPRQDARGRFGRERPLLRLVPRAARPVPLDVGSRPPGRRPPRPRRLLRLLGPARPAPALRPVRGAGCVRLRTAPAPAESRYDLDAHLEGVEALLDEPATILGHSTGCLLALGAAVRWPELVRHDVLTGLPAWPGRATALAEVGRLGPWPGDRRPATGEDGSSARPCADTACWRRRWRPSPSVRSLRPWPSTVSATPGPAFTAPFATWSWPNRRASCSPRWGAPSRPSSAVTTGCAGRTMPAAWPTTIPACRWRS